MLIQDSLPSYVLSVIDFEELDLVGRVFCEEKAHYILMDNSNREYLIDKKSSPLMCVGDWFIFDSEKKKIDKVIPEKNLIRRIKNNSTQRISSNVDQMWIVTSANRDLNLNRIERYIHVAKDAFCEPVIILTKIDLIQENELHLITKDISDRFPDVKVLKISIQEKLNCQTLLDELSLGKTIALLGSSGVGKSTLINFLSEGYVQKTIEIGASERGKHTTTNRKMFLLNSGTFIIDNPGIRAVAPVNFKSSHVCKFSDCTHTNEPGCEVLNMLHNGEMSEEAYKNLGKMQRQAEHESLQDQPLKLKVRRQQWKAISKGIKARNISS